MKEIAGKCKNCGAPTKWDGSSLFVECAFCGNKSIVGNQVFNLVELKIIYNFARNNLRYILPFLGFSLLTIGYINSRKIPVSTYATRSEAIKACDQWKERKNRAHKAKTICKDCKKETIEAFNKQGFQKDKKWSCFRDKNNYKNHLGSIYTNIDIGFGSSFDSYNKCSRKRQEILKAKDKELNNSYIHYFSSNCRVPFVAPYEQVKEVVLNISKGKGVRIFRFKEF